MCSPSLTSVPPLIWRTTQYFYTLQRLTTSFGLVDQPLAWLKSFLSDRSNSVVLGHSRSSWVPAPFGVPQGSVLGPYSISYILQTLVLCLRSWNCSITYLPMMFRAIFT